jgi:hypothetical protein
MANGSFTGTIMSAFGDSTIAIAERNHQRRHSGTAMAKAMAFYEALARDPENRNGPLLRVIVCEGRGPSELEQIEHKIRVMEHEAGITKTAFNTLECPWPYARRLLEKYPNPHHN